MVKATDQETIAIEKIVSSQTLKEGVDHAMQDHMGKCEGQLGGRRAGEVGTGKSLCCGFCRKE